MWGYWCAINPIILYRGEGEGSPAGVIVSRLHQSLLWIFVQQNQRCSCSRISSRGGWRHVIAYWCSKEAEPATHTSVPVQVECVTILSVHTILHETCNQWPCAYMGYPPTHTHTTSSHTHDHNTQQSLGWPFVMWGRIYSRSLCAAGSDLRHSSGNLCPSSCGLIRLCRPWRQHCPGNYEGIQSITHLQATCMYAHVSHLLRVLEHPSAWLTVSLFLPSCAHSCPTSCSFDCQHVCKSFCIHLAKFWRFSRRSEHQTLFIWRRKCWFLGHGRWISERSWKQVWWGD